MKVIKIGAVWCSGCLVMRPRWEEIEKENQWLKTQYFDFDQNQKEIKKFNIQEGVLPVFIFLNKKGEEIQRISGEVDKDKIISLINKYRNS